MAWRSGHGKHKGSVRIEVLPIDELPALIPAPPDPVERRPDGTLASKEAARLLGAKGGAAKAKKRRELLGLGFAELAEDAEFHRYWKVSEALMEAKLADLANQCGGFVGPGPTTFIATGSRMYAASLYLADMAMRTNGPACAKLWHDSTQQAIASRQQFLAALEMALKEAKSRADNRPINPQDALFADSEPEPEPDEGAESEDIARKDSDGS